MDLLTVEFLSRLQFAAAVFFHFLFVPLTLGLSLLIAIMQTMHYRSGREVYRDMAKFWGKLFIINFTLGVVTGITLVFQFGTNWARYSAFVGAVFGPLLAIEATAAFFLESTFIAIWHFGWNRVGKRLHLASIWLVTLAGNISAFWIILANGWMQNPMPGKSFVVEDGAAKLTDFVALLTNPYAWGQFAHTILGAWALSGFFVLGISALRHLLGSGGEVFTRSVRLAAPFTLFAVLGLTVSGHWHGNTVARLQPAKLAAMESHWETRAAAPLYLLTIPDEARERNLVQALPIPSGLSLLAFSDPDATVIGLRDIPKQDRPPVLITFLSFRFMVGLGLFFLGLSALTVIFRNKLEKHRWLCRLLVINLPLPYLALAAGWAVAEVGRQPWIIYNVMRTGEAVSPVAASSVGLSLLAFVGIYSFLGLVALALMLDAATGGAVLRAIKSRLAGRGVFGKAIREIKND